MGDKSTRKKNYILEKARGVFQKNGYRAVTMKDIVDACDISRGGLYLYFSSTREIFEAILSQEDYDAKTIIDAARGNDTTPAELLLIYLSDRKKAILNKKDNLSAATLEYLFESRQLGNASPAKKRFNSDVNEIKKLINEGIEQEWIVCDDPDAAARSIVYTLEGLKTTAQTIGLTADEVDKEIEYIMGTLGLVVE